MSTQPNIILIFSDQQRWDTVGCYGQPLPVTPHLDRMAAEGVRFEHAFTCQPVCGPARACLQTGKYATEIGCFKNEIPLPATERTLAHYLSDAGYETGYIGKWHLASNGRWEHNVPGKQIYHAEPIPPERRGGYKDYWLASDLLEFTSHGYDGYLYDGDMQRVDFTGYRVDALTNFALDFLRTRSRTRPFFLMLSFLEPHHQNDHHRYEGPDGSQERFKNFTPPGDLVNLEGDWDTQYPDYLGCCASLDENVGRIRAELQHLDLAEQTIVLYLSDHGSHFRTRNRDREDRNYDDYKRSCHEASIRIPMIMAGPGFEGGRVLPEMVSLLDVPPTILTAAGVPVPPVMRGRPLQALINGSAADWRTDIFVQISESQVGRALRTDRWKYAIRAPGKSGATVAASDTYAEYALYDLTNDPYEQRNLVRDLAFGQVRQELAARLQQRMAEAGERLPVIHPA